MSGPDDPTGPDHPTGTDGPSGSGDPIRPDGLGPLLAAGRTADVYAVDDDRVLKLFHEGTDEETVRREVVATRLAAESGLPVPGIHDVVRIRGRRGILLEHAGTASLGDRVRGRPWALRGAARTLADLHAAVHERTAETLPPTREHLERAVRDAGLSDWTTRRALEALADLPDGETLCHGDFHPENVFESDEGPVVVDWRDATRGDPAADVARTLVVIRAAGARASGVDGRLRALGYRTFRRWYLRRYLSRTELERGRVRAWTLPVTVARASEAVPGERRWLALRATRLAGEFERRRRAWRP